MTYFKIAIPAITAASLAACSTTTPAPTLPNVPTVGMANYTGGTYHIVTNGVDHTMTGTISLLLNNMISWQGGDVTDTMKGSGFLTADVLALSAMNKAGPNGTFAGIAGTLGTVPTSGSATYDTNIRFQLLEPMEVHTYGLGGFTITANFGAATINGSTGFVTTIQGNIVGSEFTGTVSSMGAVNGTVTTVPMQGGFYGAAGGTIAGAFAGTGMSGVFGGAVVAP